MMRKANKNELTRMKLKQQKVGGKHKGKCQAYREQKIWRTQRWCLWEGIGLEYIDVDKKKETEEREL
jgi:hypothetical protein